MSSKRSRLLWRIQEFLHLSRYCRSFGLSQRLSVLAILLVGEEKRRVKTYVHSQLQKWSPLSRKDA